MVWLAGLRVEDLAMLKIVKVFLPAAWASALINDDWSGIEYYDPDEAAKAREWLATSGLSVLSCGEETFAEVYDGLITECLDYYCTPRSSD